MQGPFSHAPYSSSADPAPSAGTLIGSRWRGWENRGPSSSVRSSLARGPGHVGGRDDRIAPAGHCAGPGRPPPSEAAARPPISRSRPSVHPDGSCDRTIWQPEGELLPPEARRPDWSDHWRSCGRSSHRRPSRTRSGRGGERTYFTAVGSFRNPGEIPSHFRHAIESCPEVGASELVRSYERRDCGFVIEHRWSERLTNIVTRAPDS